MKKPTLTEQLLLICVSIIFIVIISLGIVLPRTLLPVYEENLYNYLNQSLSLLEKVDNNKINSEIAYIYIDSDNNVFVSNNLSSVININSIDKLLDNINDIKGKFVYKNKIYYYATESNNNIKKIAITGSSYINFMRAEILKII